MRINGWTMSRSPQTLEHASLVDSTPNMGRVASQGAHMR